MQDDLQTLIREAAQAGMQDQPPARPASRPAGPLRTAVLTVVLTLAVAGSAWGSIVFNREPNPFTHESETNGIRGQMLLAIEELEDYRMETGAYPSDLESVGLAEDWLTYTPFGEDYRMVGRVVTDQGPQEFEYQPGDDLAPFERALEAELRGGV